MHKACRLDIDFRLIEASLPANKNTNLPARWATASQGVRLIEVGLYIGFTGRPIPAHMSASASHACLHACAILVAEILPTQRCGEYGQKRIVKEFPSRIQ